MAVTVSLDGECTLQNTFCADGGDALDLGFGILNFEF